MASNLPYGFTQPDICLCREPNSTPISFIPFSSKALGELHSHRRVRSEAATDACLQLEQVLRHAEQLRVLLGQLLHRLHPLHARHGLELRLGQRDLDKVPQADKAWPLRYLRSERQAVWRAGGRACGEHDAHRRLRRAPALCGRLTLVSLVRPHEVLDARRLLGRTVGGW